MSLFKIDDKIYYSTGGFSDKMEVPKNPNYEPVAGGNVKLTIKADPQNEQWVMVMIEAFAWDFNPNDRIKLIGLVNNLDFSVNFKNLETPGDDKDSIAGKSSTLLPGQYGKGCDIPNCSEKKDWGGKRMVVCDTETDGRKFTLSVFTIGADIYCTFAEFPTELHPLPGGFSQGNGWRKVLILNGPKEVELQDRQEMGLEWRQIKPRNIAWVQSMPPNLNFADLADIAWSRFSHIIVCFFHLDPLLVLKYNNDKADDFTSLWHEYYRMSQTGPRKTVMIGVGGRGSGTWEWVWDKGKEKVTQAAETIANFVSKFKSPESISILNLTTAHSMRSTAGSPPSWPSSCAAFCRTAS